MSNKGSRLSKILDAQASLFRLLYKPFRRIFTPVLVPCFFGILFYVLGYTLKYFPAVEIILNNGFYVMGIHTQFRFAELFGTLGLMISMIGTVLTSSMNLTPRTDSQTQTVVPLNEAEIYTPKTNIYDLAGNLTLLEFSQEKALHDIEIDSLYHLEKAKAQDIQRVLGITPTLAQQIIDEAKEVVRDFRSQGLI